MTEILEIISQAKTIAQEIKEGKRQFAVPDTYDISNVPIFAAGRWNGETYSEKDIDDMVSAFEETKGFMKPYLKLGHDGNQKLVQKDGMPAAGWVERLYREGKTLYADFSKVPKKIFDLVTAGAYRKISSEIWWNFNFNGKVYRRMLKAASFLGADWPGVSTLDDIIALYASPEREVKAYEGNGEIRTFEADKDQLTKEDSPMKELQEQLAEAQNELAEAKVKLKELSVKDERIKVLETDLESTKKSLADMTTKSSDFEAQVQENSQKTRELEVNGLLDKAIQEKKLLPAQRAFAFTLLMNAETSKKFKVGDKEQTVDELLKAFINANSVDVNTDEHTEAGRKQNHSEDNSGLDAQVRQYMEKNKVSYKEALLSVSPANKSEKE